MLQKFPKWITKKTKENLQGTFGLWIHVLRVGIICNHQALTHVWLPGKAWVNGFHGNGIAAWGLFSMLSKLGGFVLLSMEITFIPFN